MGDKGFIDRLFDRAEDKIGDVIEDLIEDTFDKVASSDVLENSIEKVVNQATDNLKNDIQITKEKKTMQFEEAKKVEGMPAKCPHCNAPTNKQAVCEYCGCKIIE